MAEPSQSDRLLEWGLGTFHASFFILALLVFLFARRALGELLGSLNTLAGFALFGVLWYTTLFSTRRAMRALRQKQGDAWDVFGHSVDAWELVFLGAFWGGVNGVLFFLALLLFAVFFLILPEAGGSPDALVALPFYGLLGSGVAAILGGIAGFLLAMIDVLLLVISRFILKNTIVL